jgi:E3 ubiquitin-protein ligase UBR4
MIPMGEVILSKEKDTSAFPELMSVMQTLAGAGQGVGHKTLFPAATGWLEIWYEFKI